MKNWIKLTALMLSLLLLLTGCNLIATDPVLDAQQAVVQVNDAVVTKGEALDALSNAINEAYYMSMFQGYSLDFTDEAVLSSIRESVISDLVDEQVVLQKAKELSLDTFTEEEMAEFAAKADEEWQSNIDYVKTMSDFLTAHPDLEEGDPALDEAANQYLLDLGMTKDEAIQAYQEDAEQTRVREYAIADVTVPEEEVRALYDTNLATQKDRYLGEEGMLSNYYTDLSNGTDIYYTPGGLRFIKHVLIKPDAEATARIGELETALSTNEGTRLSLEEQITAYDHYLVEDADHEGHDHGDITEADLAEMQKNRDELTAQLDELQTEYAAQQAELTQLQDEAYAAALTKAEEVLDKAKMGLNFDKLIESYGEDPGMQGTFKATGYPTAEGFAIYETPFQEAAMALQNVGDLSEPVKGANGYHILKYDSDSVEQETPYEDLQEKLYSTLLTTAQNEAYTAALDQWRSAAKVKTYPERLAQ